MKLEIHQDKCYVDKRKLVLAFSLTGSDWSVKTPDRMKTIEYVFSADHWDEEKISYTLNGKEMPKDEDGRSYTEARVLSFYKHNLQACIPVWEGELFLFIDRRYEHNHSYDVYFAGEHYLVGKENV